MNEPIREQSFERSLPNSTEAERAVLAAILLDNAVIDQASSELVPEQFYVPSHRRIFEAMRDLRNRESDINPVLIGEVLNTEGLLESVGGISFITNLTYGVPHSSNIRHYTKVIRAKALLRSLIKEFNKRTQEALAEEDEAEVVLDHALESLFGLAIQANLSTKKTRTYSEIADSVYQLFEKWSEGKTTTIPTGIPELDHKLAYGGLSLQDFIIIAARSSFGKTALALQVGVNASRAGHPVLIFPLEMSGEKLFMRNLASVTEVPHFKIAPWTFQHDTHTAGKILNGIARLQNRPIQVEDRVHELNRMSAIAREWKRRHPQPGLIIVDYLQLVKNKNDKRSRQEEVAGISTEMKRLAQELNVPVIGVSQFNRAPATQNRRPELSDLRESGQLEQDADVVLFPWSEDGLKDVAVRGMKLYCPKQRNGSVGWEIPIDFDGEKQWFFTEQLYREARFA